MLSPACPAGFFRAATATRRATHHSVVPPSEQPYLKSIPAPGRFLACQIAAPPQARFAWPHRTIVLRYGVSILAVAAAVLVMQALAMLARWDTRPLLMVAVAVSALYGGTGPGIVAAFIGGFISSEPGVVLAGVALTLTCRILARPAKADKSGATKLQEPATAMPPAVLEGTGGSITFSSETRAPPTFVGVSTEATWRFHHEKPLDITLPEDEQVEHLYLYSFLAECNDAFARMYGFRAALDVIGTRLVVFCPPVQARECGLPSFLHPERVPARGRRVTGDRPLRQRQVFREQPGGDLRAGSAGGGVGNAARRHGPEGALSLRNIAPGSIQRRARHSRDC